MNAHQHRHVETLVIGASQSGLAAGYHLKQRGRAFLVVEQSARIGDAWRSRWDSLRLFTTARLDGLPGMPFPAPRSHYPTKDEVADYLEAYAARFELPVETGMVVRRLTRSGEVFEATTADGTVRAEAVVLATGMYRVPRVPALAQALSPDIVQLHSSHYRNPAQLAPGPVLVVGAGNSGAEIALEVASTHPTSLAGRDPGQEPTSAGTVPDRLIQPLAWFLASRVLSVTNPLGRRVRDSFLHPPRGIPRGRVRLSDVDRADVRRVPRVSEVRDGLPVAGDAGALDVRTVIWCTGFDPDLSWVDLPLHLRDGYLENDRGAVPDQPGLYVLGLAFQTSLASALLGGVGRDAARVVAHLAAWADNRSGAVPAVRT